MSPTDPGAPDPSAPDHGAIDHGAIDHGAPARLATRLAFLAAGFAMAWWAPLVPYAKQRLGVDEGGLGLLLLCLGAGSVLTMPLVGLAVGRWGCRRVALTAGGGVCLALPGLALANSVPELAATLLLFGASLGALDVSMNVHAVLVERAAGRPLMSGFHGLFSVGGFVGSAALTALLAAGATPAAATMLATVAVAAVMLTTRPRLLRQGGGGDGPALVRPHGLVVLLGGLAFAAFLTEGAILDWTALFLTQERGLPTAQGGLGYALFSLAMTAGRLTGDRVVAALGGRRVLLWGGLSTVAGLAGLVLLPWAAAGLAGLVLVGLGAANLVPVLFSAAGRQHAMPVGLAVAAMSTLGYAGILVGPAAVGFVAHGLGLPLALGLLAVLMLALPLASRRVGAE